MKLFFSKSLPIIFFFLTSLTFAQDIQIITHQLTKYEPVGTFEIVIDFEVVNISQFGANSI